MADHASLTFAAAIRTTLEQAMEGDESVVLLGETVGRAGGVAETTRGLQQAHPDRVRDLPVADRGTVGLAVGMALAGKRPVVELADSGRLPALLEVLSDAASIGSRREFQVPLVVRVPYGTEARGLDQPAGRAVVPGLRVLCPSTPEQASGLLRFALQASSPTVLLEPRALYLDRGPVSGRPAAPGLAVRREGSHVTLAAWGAGVQAALQAAEQLAAEGIDAEVLDLVSLAPVDGAALGQHVQRTGRLVVVHDGDAQLAALVRGAGVESAFLYLESPLAEAASSPDGIARAARDSVHF